MESKLRPRLEAWIAGLRANPRWGDWLAAAGAALYLVQSYRYLFALRSILDEGLYLVKGYYFALGNYAPFQDYGFLTNHMPLSFLIPGYVQTLFGPGLRTGRYYAFVLGALALLGLWVAARRLGGRWWAAVSLWALALSPTLVKEYSVAFSQVLVAAMVAWLLALVLGKRLPSWQAVLAGVLGAASVMTRINMAPLLALVVLYAFWRHERRSAIVLTVSALATLVLLHLAFWPGILRLWSYWLPQGWFSFLEGYYSPWRKYETFTASPFAYWIRHLDDPIWDSFQAFWDGIAYNFLATVGVAINLLLWRVRREWPAERYKTAVFLNLAYISLFAIHAWAALSGNSCTFFCFSGYLAFFNALGLLALIATAPYWRLELQGARRIVALGLVLLMGLGLGFAAADHVGLSLANLEIPRLWTSGGGSVALWGPLEALFGWSIDDTRIIVPTLLGLALAALYLAGLWRLTRRSGSASQAALVGLLVLSLVLGPTTLFSGGDKTLDCGGDVVASYEAAAVELAARIPVGSQVYYQGPNSPVILLYLGGVGIYPSQMNNVFSFSPLTGAEIDDELLRFGYWNERWAQQWAAEADYILLEGRHYPQWQADTEAGLYSVSYVSDPVENCRGKDSEIILLQNSR